MNSLMRIAATLFLLAFMQTAYGQKATEIFIPVGKSPGLSDWNKYFYSRLDGKKS